jgi:predicted transcriptional regulator
MHYKQAMDSYIKQLTNMSAPTGISLMLFFKQAGVPTSTYYRAKAGKDLRLSTARKVEDAITSYSLHKAESEYD